MNSERRKPATDKIAWVSHFRFEGNSRGYALLIAALFAGAACNHPGAPTPTPAAVVTPPVVADPPSIACPGTIAVTASTTSAGATVAYQVPDSEKGQGPVTVDCQPGPGAAFPVGITNVECVATDSLHRSSSCTFAVSVAAPPRLRRARIMAFGDSITEGQVVIPNTDSVLLESRSETAYPTVLLKLLQARYTDQTVTVFNRGRATERSDLALSRFIGTFGGDAPDVVVLLEGYNDIIFGETGALGIAAAERGVSALAADARNRGARVFICTLTPGKPGRRQIAMSAILAANDRLRVVARGEGAVLVDTFNALLPNVDENVGSDGLHLTPAGYRRVAETVFAAIGADLEIK
jgi:lysophospholipase L1-like esterase